MMANVTLWEESKKTNVFLCLFFWVCVFVVVCLSEVLDQSSMALICKASDTNIGSES